jgi:hypothetical protein
MLSQLKRNYFHAKPLDATQLQTWRQYLDAFSARPQIQPETIDFLYERCLVPCVCCSFHTIPCKSDEICSDLFGLVLCTLGDACFTQMLSDQMRFVLLYVRYGICVRGSTLSFFSHYVVPPRPQALYDEFWLRYARHLMLRSEDKARELLARATTHIADRYGSRP